MKLTESQLRKVVRKIIKDRGKKSSLLRESSRPRRKSPSLASLLFEAEAPPEEMKPVTIVALYGPPAAGKGAAKKDVGTFVGAEDEQNYKDWLKSQGEEGGKYFQEEDEKMVDAMTKVLPPLIFKEIHARVDGGEDFDSVVADYFHVNESDKEFKLSDLISKSAYDKVVKDSTDETAGKVDVEKAAKQFAEFPNTADYFTQARGFSKEIEGAGDLNQYFGDYEGKVGNQTLGMRQAAASSYLDDVKSELASMGASEEGDSTYAGVYLMDQAGESSADTGRIKDLIKLKKESAPGAVTLIGVYIAQPQERTELANLHRAATGGRRVSTKEVDRIFDSGPKFKDDGSLDMDDLGPAIEAMTAGFDQVHVYQPEKPFSTEKADEFASKICAPLGDGKGSFDIEGCPDMAGPKTKARSYKGMEKQAVKSAGLEDNESFEGGYFPKADKLRPDDSDAIVAALEKMGFSGVATQDLDAYLTTMKVPDLRGGGEYGDLPSKDLFGKGTSPTKRTEIPTKAESARSQKNTDDVILERWQKLAGLLND